MPVKLLLASLLAISFLLSCERQSEWTPLTVPLNITLVRYEKANPTFCTSLPRKAIYKRLEHIEDQKQRQLTFLINLGLCHHKRGNIAEARLNIMRALHLAETYEDYPEIERIALSYFAESVASNNPIDYGWANKKLLNLGLQNYGISTELNSGLETAREYRAKEAIKNFEKYLGDNHEW